jgi:hypothetical protein
MDPQNPSGLAVDDVMECMLWHYGPLPPVLPSVPWPDSHIS